ncbi:MAG: class I SAM-dependent methyltransferase [Rickettsiales bacterium]|jgi:ubiquinone/menaquinone biosynthesis C-methylase UbiE|nr:class I SAM-dependent methyltransferase [Rickettsiales bacterium]
MANGRTWDTASLFEGTAPYYARFRPGYPKDLFNYLLEYFAVGVSDSVLDLGCGTGQIALEMAPEVGRVLAVDPQPGMLEEGKKLAGERGLTNIEWLLGQDRDVPALARSKVRLTTIGRAFHWMDREQLLEDLYPLTREGGGVAIVGDSKFGGKDREWETARNGVIEKYLGSERRAGIGGTYSHPTKLHEEVLRESKFRDIRLKSFSFSRTWTLDQVLGYCYSTSFCSLALLGDRRELFEEDLRRELLKLEPTGLFQDSGEFGVLVGTK